MHVHGACVLYMHIVYMYVSFNFHSKCASVAARYELKEVFDNLIITLCKFTALLNTHEVSKVLQLLSLSPKNCVEPRCM